MLKKFLNVFRPLMNGFRDKINLKRYHHHVTYMLSILGGYSSKSRGILWKTTFNDFHVETVTNFAACRDLDKHFYILQNIETATTSILR